MESRSKLFGHPVHPMLVVFPVGLFATAVICDIIYLITRNTFFNIVAFYNIIIGIIGGLTAAIFGFADWLALPSGTRAKSIGGMHGLGNVTLVALFLLSWLTRRPNDNFTPTTLSLVFSFAGILLALLTAWLGGELVYRLGVAADRGANLNAPSSLSGRPAMGTASPSGMMGSSPVVAVTGDTEEDEQKDEDDAQDRGR